MSENKHDSAAQHEAAKVLDVELRETAVNASAYLDMLNVKIVQMSTAVGDPAIAPWQLLLNVETGKGWDSFESYLSDVVEKSMPRMHKLDRAAVILALSDAGLSQRAIADSVKKSPATVNAEIKRANANAARGLDRLADSAESGDKAKASKGKAQATRTVATTTVNAAKNVTADKLSKTDNGVKTVTDAALLDLRDELQTALRKVNAEIKARGIKVQARTIGKATRSGAQGTVNGQTDSGRKTA